MYLKYVSFGCDIQVNFKKMLDAVAANNPSQVTKLTDKGLDPNFHVDKTGGMVNSRPGLGWLLS